MASNYAKIWIDMLDEAKVDAFDSIWLRFIERILLAKGHESRRGKLPDTFDMAFRLRP